MRAVASDGWSGRILRRMGDLSVGIASSVKNRTEGLIGAIGL
jgi:hypothetical protein